MNINISNASMKYALTNCLDIYDIKYSIHGNTLKIQSAISSLKKNSIKVLDQNTGELFKDMNIMLHFLNEKNETIIYFSLNDIILIKNHYFFINPNKLVPFESNIITIEYPITLDEFASPELKLIEEVPFSIPVQTCYYSLANVLLYLLTGKHYNNLEDLQFIYYSPLYFCMERMLLTNPYDRKFIYI